MATNILDLANDNIQQILSSFVSLTEPMLQHQNMQTLARLAAASKAVQIHVHEAMMLRESAVKAELIRTPHLRVRVDLEKDPTHAGFSSALLYSVWFDWVKSMLASHNADHRVRALQSFTPVVLKHCAGVVANIMCDDEDYDVRWQALQTLGQLGWVDLVQYQREIMLMIIRQSETAVDLIRSTTRQERYDNAMQILYKLDPEIAVRMMTGCCNSNITI